MFVSFPLNLKSVEVVILPVLSHYHTNIVTQQLHTGLSYFVSTVFDI